MEQHELPVGVVLRDYIIFEKNKNRMWVKANTHHRHVLVLRLVVGRHCRRLHRRAWDRDDPAAVHPAVWPFVRCFEPYLRPTCCSPFRQWPCCYLHWWPLLSPCRPPASRRLSLGPWAVWLTPLLSHWQRVSLRRQQSHFSASSASTAQMGPAHRRRGKTDRTCDRWKLAKVKTLWNTQWRPAPPVRRKKSIFQRRPWCWLKKGARTSKMQKKNGRTATKIFILPVCYPDPVRIFHLFVINCLNSFLCFFTLISVSTFKDY